MPRLPDTSPQTVSVLRALLEDPQAWHYGYPLSKRTGLASGTLYPILIRLEDRGALETRWEPPSMPGRPSRHLYRLTPAGMTLAEARLHPDCGFTPRNPDLVPDMSSSGRHSGGNGSDDS